MKTANVKTKAEKGPTLNGNNTSRLLEYLTENNTDIPFLDAFRSLRRVQTFSAARELTNSEVQALKEAIDDFSTEYRSYNELSRISKLHGKSTRLILLANTEVGAYTASKALKESTSTRTRLISKVLESIRTTMFTCS